MKKYSFFIFEPEYTTFLHHLRNLGVVHISERQDTASVEHIQELRAKLAELEELRKHMQRVVSLEESSRPKGAKGDTASTAQQYSDATATIHEYGVLLSEYRTTEAKIEAQRKERDELMRQVMDLRAWGDFDPALIHKLASAGYHLHYYTVPTHYYDPEWASLYGAIVISEVGRSTYYVTVSTSPTPAEIEHSESITLPKDSLSVLEARLRGLEARMQAESAYLYALALRTDLTDAQELTLRDDLLFDTAYQQGEHLYDGKLVVLEGWVPAERATALEAALDGEGVAYKELEIAEGESVPIKLKNNRFNRVFEPILELFSLPNYTELDPTPFFAPFFMLFFGICFGDAGYGILLLIGATIIKLKAKPGGMYDILELMQWLGAAGIVIGFFSGTFFGIPLPEVAFLAPIKQVFIDQNTMMILSLMIGLVQILFAKYVSAIKTKKQHGLAASLSLFAWPTLILILSLIVALPLMSIELPAIVLYAMYGVAGLSALLVLFYNSPGKNVFANFGQGLWHTYNTATGLMGDILSYIRLFAIGLTGGILGGVFNMIATSTTEGLPWYVRFPVALIILLLGHGINFGLTMIGALVHPVRLIYVEYFNNSDFEGGGEKYTPLRKISAQD